MIVLAEPAMIVYRGDMLFSHFRSVTIALLALAACGDDGKTTEASSAGSTGGGTTTTNGTTTSDTTTTSTTATSGPTSGMSGTASTEPATTEPATTEPATTEPATTGPQTTGPETTGPMTTGETTGVGSTGEMTGGSTGVPPEGCANLGPQQCMMTDGCMAIVGQKINVQKMCLQKPTFLECADAAGCGDALTIGCPMGTTELWQFPDTCLPSDYEPCEGMVVEKPC